MRFKRGVLFKVQIGRFSLRGCINVQITISGTCVELCFKRYLVRISRIWLVGI